MRKLILAAIPILSLAAAAPVFSQGLQTPSAPNATPPAGTLRDGRSSTVKRRTPARAPRPAQRRLQSEQQMLNLQTSNLQTPSLQAPRNG